jgi:hypothetical protein
MKCQISAVTAQMNTRNARNETIVRAILPTYHVRVAISVN